ncbi:membrane alanyl aminopeptidase-like [Trichoplusia ni]|uniref:Aminopeptidase n=1 Tax=Trichoplusia ni TaxID=7111 RepID=A0A7E5WAD5_TRINI|nr:membrane alanyl aminopeptidase-like [Trichoplusia ni]
MYRNLLAIALLCLLTDGTYSDTNYRLNTPIVPARYVLILTPYFDTGDSRAFTFDGIVNIQFTTKSNTNQIKIHSEDLNFTAADVYVGTYPGNVSLGVSTLEFDTNYTFAYINLASNLEAGVEYGLQIKYKGHLRTDLNGFYRSFYFENGVKKWLGSTQMEPTHARKAFPCFDEPELKAVFQMRIDRPANYKPSLTNTKRERSEILENGYIRDYFYPTPRMSTYLVAFLISEFTPGITITNDNREFGIYSRPEANGQTSLAFKFGREVVDALGKYFGIDYYYTNSNLQLDHVALPNFRAGAMENWGLITYREALLLYDDEESNAYFRYRVVQIIAHETTHMWFGNLVTCHWWSNTWLNEGFANYFQDYITATLDPKSGAANQLVIGSVYSAYKADSSSSSVPITNNDVNSPAEISNHFGTVTYQKAGSVIRMIHHLIQDDAFKFGLNSYLTSNSFDAGYPEKLYQGLSGGVSTFNALSSYSNTNISDIMNSWITQAGHPLLTVNINYDTETVTLTQKRFYSNSSISSNEVYKIPITYTTQLSPNFENTKPVFIMENKTHEFTIRNISQSHPWILFNVQETGLYRVNYDDHAWGIILSALKNYSNVIHPLNRAKIVNDLFALQYVDEVSFSTLLSGLEFLHKETEYSVWFAAVDGFKSLLSRFVGDVAMTQALKDLILPYLDSAISVIGYDSASDDVEFLRNRMQLLELACKLEHSGCVEKAVSLFTALKINGTKVAPSLRPVVYCTGLRKGDSSDFDFLWTRLKNSNIASEQWVIQDALGCINDEKKLISYLFSMLDPDSPIQSQDQTKPLASVLSDYEHRTVVINSLKTDYKTWSSIHPSMDTILSTVASVLRTDDDFTLFESFLASCSECNVDSLTGTKAALVNAKAVKSWSDSHKAEMLLALGGTTGSSSLAMPSLLTIILGLAGLLMSIH